MYRVFPLVPLFTLASLILVCLEWFRLPLLLQMHGHGWILAGGVLVVLGTLAAMVRGGYRLAYDLFLFGCLLVWFPYWREIYRVDAPVFVFYPLYFVVLIVVLTQTLVYRFADLDALQYRMLKVITGFRLMHPLLLGGLVLAGIYLRDYFIFFPMVVSFLVIRGGFSVVLDEVTRASADSGS